jgi:dCMP deaminase
MDGRISRAQMYLEMARSASKRATCHRLNVGAIVTHQNSPVSVGWNGAEAGAPHCAGNDCPGIVPGNCGTLHAEANALKKAATLLDVGSVVDLYVTHSPCGDCSLLIQNHSLHVGRIFFEIPYRSTHHLGMFSMQYIDQDNLSAMRKTEVYEVTPAGYIVEYFTRRVVELP